MQHFDLIGFFSIGFFGGLGHCIGMCHPFVLYISGRFVKDRKGRISVLIPHAWYNLGRVVTYSILGAIAGVLGDITQMAGSLVGIQKAAAVVAGGFLCLYALLSFTGYNLITRMEKKLPMDKVIKIITSLQPRQPLTTGMLLGLLPCGLLYSALIAATSSASVAKGAVSLALFGFGTFFAMMVIAVLGNILMKQRGLFNTVGSVFLLVMGVYYIVSGIRY